MVYHSVGEIYDDIEKARGELHQRIARLSRDEEHRRETPDSWSVAEVVEHLAKTEAGIAPLFFKLLKRAEAENLVSDGNLGAPISFAGYAAKLAGAKFNAPEILLPEGRATLAESLAALGESRKTIANLRARFEKFDHSKSVYPHPVFGNLNLYEWLAFIGLHERRHLAQIERILPPN